MLGVPKGNKIRISVTHRAVRKSWNCLQLFGWIGHVIAHCVPVEI